MTVHGDYTEGQIHSIPESEQRLLEDASTNEHHASIKKTGRSLSLRAIVIAQTLVIVLLLGTLVLSHSMSDVQLSDRCVRYLNAGTPMNSAVRYEKRDIDVSTRHHSRWRGQPSHEVDVAWHDIARENLLFITDSEVLLAGKDPSKIVRLPPQYEHRYGSGALALTEYGVQLSCLNWLRVYIHADYYRQHDDFHIFEKNSNETLLLKLGHCIDLLREALMCNAGTSIITQQWIKDRPRMIPDLRVPKKTCVDFDALVRWTKEREIDEMKHPVNKKVVFGHHNPVKPQPTEFVYSHVP